MNDSTGSSPGPNPLESLESLRRLDHRHFWHPFTQMQDWCASAEDPLVLVSGEAATLTDYQGNRYIDGNSSIWTNLHGHRHPSIDTAIREQLDRLAHCSALGFSNEPAIRLAAKLAEVSPGGSLERVFFTDDGSTAIECACRLAVQYRERRGDTRRRRFVAFDGAYHGDTLGAASLGGTSFQAVSGYPVTRVRTIEDLESLPPEVKAEITAVIIEPLIQGAAGMRLWPVGLLRRLRDWCDGEDVFLILDEVMTGFGRTGRLFACEHERVVPDFLCLAKGLTGGYLPLAATLTTERIFAAFLGTWEQQRTFFYGHSYCGNPLACAAALASLQVFEDEAVLEKLPDKITFFSNALKAAMKRCPHFGELRQIGLIAGIDLTDAKSGAPLDWRHATGARVCRAARSYGLLTRPIRDTLVLMPPLCVSEAQILSAIEALESAATEVLS